MPRKARIDAPGALHHIITRGIEGRPIFQNAADREDFIVRFSRLIIDTDLKKENQWCDLVDLRDSS